MKDQIFHSGGDHVSFKLKNNHWKELGVIEDLKTLNDFLNSVRYLNLEFNEKYEI